MPESMVPLVAIFWIRRQKDTLAFGNITGAIVFQGSILPAIGMLLTPWDLRREVLVRVVVTYGAALWLRFVIRSAHLRVWHLIVNGGFYLTYTHAGVKSPSSPAPEGGHEYNEKGEYFQSA